MEKLDLASVVVVVLVAMIIARAIADWVNDR